MHVSQNSLGALPERNKEHGVSCFVNPYRHRHAPPASPAPHSQGRRISPKRRGFGCSSARLDARTRPGPLAPSQQASCQARHARQRRSPCVVVAGGAQKRTASAKAWLSSVFTVSRSCAPPCAPSAREGSPHESWGGNSAAEAPCAAPTAPGAAPAASSIRKASRRARDGVPPCVAAPSPPRPFARARSPDRLPNRRHRGGTRARGAALDSLKKKTGYRAARLQKVSSDGDGVTVRKKKFELGF